MSGTTQAAGGLPPPVVYFQEQQEVQDYGTTISDLRLTTGNCCAFLQDRNEAVERRIHRAGAFVLEAGHTYSFVEPKDSVFCRCVGSGVGEKRKREEEDETAQPPAKKNKKEEPNVKILIEVQGLHENSSKLVKIGNHKPLEQLFGILARIKGEDVADMRFYSKGRKLDGSKTAADYGILEKDVIEIKM